MNVAAHLLCTVCASSASIEDDGVVGAAEIATFVSAHSDHDRVTMEFRLTPLTAMSGEHY